MSETKHTPGPWIGAGPSFGDPLPRYTTEIVTEWEDEDDQRPVICTLPFRHYDHENEANARLIAAAPELLEALELAEKKLVRLHISLSLNEKAGMRSADKDPAIQEIRAAIAKAKGDHQ